MKTKKFYKSRTIWINTLLIISGVLTAIAGQLETGATLSFIGVVEIILRIITKEKLS